MHQQVVGNLLPCDVGVLRIGQPHSWAAMIENAGHAVGLVVYDVGDEHRAHTAVSARRAWVRSRLVTGRALSSQACRAVNSVAFKRRKLHHVGLPTGVNVYHLDPRSPGLSSSPSSPETSAVSTTCFTASLSNVDQLQSSLQSPWPYDRPHWEGENGVTCRFFPLYGGLCRSPLLEFQPRIGREVGLVSIAGMRKSMAGCAISDRSPGHDFRSNRSSRLAPAYQVMKSRRSMALVARIGAADSATPHPDPSVGQAPALHFLIPPS